MNVVTTIDQQKLFLLSEAARYRRLAEESANQVTSAAAMGYYEAKAKEFEHLANSQAGSIPPPRG